MAYQTRLVCFAPSALAGSIRLNIVFSSWHSSNPVNPDSDIFVRFRTAHVSKGRLNTNTGLEDYQDWRMYFQNMSTFDTMNNSRPAFKVYTHV